MKLSFFAMAVGSLAIGSNIGFASLINVDLGTSSTHTYSGAAVIGQSGDKWNAITATGTSGALSDSSGAATSVTMTLTASNSGFADHVSDSTSPFQGTDVASLMGDYLYSSSTTITLALDHLTAGVYDVYIYSCGKTNYANAATWAAAAANGGGSVTIGPNSSNISELQSGVTYGMIEVTVGDSKTATITATLTSVNIILCGLQIESVPEPASAATLTCTAVLGAFAYAWRKRRRF